MKFHIGVPVDVYVCA